MAKQQIKRLNKFPELKNLDSELDRIIKQIQDNIGILDPAIGEVYIDNDPSVNIVVAVIDTYNALGSMKTGVRNKTELLTTGFRLQTPGTYHADISVSFTCDVNNTIVRAAIFANDVEFKNTQMQVKIGTAADFATMSMNGFGVGKQSTKITLKFRADKTCTITINYMNFIIEQVL